MLNPHTRDNQGNTPLHIATYTNSLKTIKCLIEKGSDPNAINSKGRHCFTYSYWKRFKI